MASSGTVRGRDPLYFGSGWNLRCRQVGPGCVNANYTFYNFRRSWRSRTYIGLDGWVWTTPPVARTFGAP